MSENIRKSHNVPILLYYYVCTSKYGKIVFEKEVDETLIRTCKEIENRYDINVIEIGIDGEHVHFLVQSVPTISPKQIIKIIKSITAREIYKCHPEVKKKLWGRKYME